MSGIPKIVKQNRARYVLLETNGSKRWRQKYCGERNWIHDQLWPVPKSGHRYFDETLFIAESQERVSKMLDEINS